MKYFILWTAQGKWTEVDFKKLLEIARDCYAIKVMYTEDIFEIYYIDKSHDTKTKSDVTSP